MVEGDYWVLWSNLEDMKFHTNILACLDYESYQWKINVIYVLWGLWISQRQECILRIVGFMSFSLAKLYIFFSYSPKYVEQVQLFLSIWQGR